MKFDDIYVTVNQALRLAGSHPACRRDITWKMHFIFIIVFNIIGSYLLCYSIFFSEIQEGRYADASKNTVMTIVSVTTIFKYTILLIHQHSTMGLINMMNDDYELINDLSEEEKKIVLDYTAKGVKVGKIWYIVSIISTVIFPFKAILMMIYIYHNKGEFVLVHIFELTFYGPLEAKKGELFTYVMLHSLYAIFSVYAAASYTGFDPLVPIFLLHSCGQLDVVSQRILSLHSETSDEEQVQKKLKSIILKLQNIYRYCDYICRNYK